MTGKTILYELPQEGAAPVIKDDFDADVPDEVSYGPDALAYDAESGHWKFRTHNHPSRQSRSAATYEIRMPRHRVYRVVDEEPYASWAADTDDETETPDTRIQRLVYEDNGADLGVVDSTEDELLQPIRYDEECRHWRYRIHDPFFVSAEGYTSTYSVWIPRERVYYALEETE